MNRNQWSASERAEFDEVCALAWESSSSQSERTNRFLHLLRDAIQSHRPWAGHVADHCQRIGAQTLLKSQRKSANLVAVSIEGKILTKPRMIGTQGKDSTGRQFFSQTLFDYLTWEQLLDKREEYLTQVRSYNNNVATMDKLLALRQLAPAASTPAEAATQIGTTIEQWLGKAA